MTQYNHYSLSLRILSVSHQDIQAVIMNVKEINIK